MQRRAFLAVQWQVYQSDNIVTHQGWGVSTLPFPADRDNIQAAADWIALLNGATPSASVIVVSMCWAGQPQDE